MTETPTGLDMREALRKTLAIIAAAFAVLLGWITLTVPMVQATAPAVLMIACAVVAYAAWPRHPGLGGRGDGPPTS